MAIKLLNTRDAGKINGLKIGVYGASGAGKTTLASTFGVPTLILSAEAGLLSLAGHDIDVIEVSTVAQVGEVYSWLLNGEGEKYQAVVLDSITEIGNVLLNEEKAKTKDGRAAYGATSEQMMAMLRAFRDLPGRHVLFLAQLDKVKDESTGAVLFGPAMPGQRLGQALPYLTDEVFAMRVERNPEGEIQRYLQTQPDNQWQAKDRSGKLNQFEVANLAEIIAKIIG